MKTPDWTYFYYVSYKPHCVYEPYWHPAHTWGKVPRKDQTIHEIIVQEDLDAFDPEESVQVNVTLLNSDLFIDR